VPVSHGRGGGTQAQAGSPRPGAPSGTRPAAGQPRRRPRPVGPGPVRRSAELECQRTRTRTPPGRVTQALGSVVLSLGRSLTVRPGTLARPGLRVTVASGRDGGGRGGPTRRVGTSEFDRDSESRRRRAPARLGDSDSTRTRPSDSASGTREAWTPRLPPAAMAPRHAFGHGGHCAGTDNLGQLLSSVTRLNAAAFNLKLTKIGQLRSESEPRRDSERGTQKVPDQWRSIHWISFKERCSCSLRNLWTELRLVRCGKKD
jgi:hypothetical protein